MNLLGYHLVAIALWLSPWANALWLSPSGYRLVAIALWLSPCGYRLVDPQLL